MNYNLLNEIEKCYKQSLFSKIFYESQNEFNSWYNNFYTNYKETQELVETFDIEISTYLKSIKDRDLKHLNPIGITTAYQIDERKIHYLIKVYKKLYELVQLNNSSENRKSLHNAYSNLINLINTFIKSIKEIFHLNLCTPYKWNNKKIDINNLTVQSYFDDNYFAFNHYFGYNNLTKIV